MKAARRSCIGAWPTASKDLRVVKDMLRLQVGALITFAKSEGLTLKDFLEVLSEALRKELPAFVRDGFAFAEEGLVELLTDEGGCVGVRAAAEIYGKQRPVGPRRIVGLIRDAKIIAYRTKEAGDYAIPVWQFSQRGGLLKGIAKALEELKKSESFEPITPFAFFLQENGWIDGKTPLHAIRSGHIPQVIFAAKVFAKT